MSALRLALADAWRRRPRLVLAVALFSALTLVFSVRFVVGVVYWTVNSEAPVRPWMTVGYVGHSWHLDPRAIDEAAGLPKPEGEPLTLQEIADRRGVPVATVIGAVEAAVARLRAETAAEPRP